MTRKRELARLRDRVAAERRRVAAVEAPWVLPALAFVSGLFVPPITGSRSANPIRQAFVFVRGYAVRAVRFVIYRNLWQLLRGGGASHATTSIHTAESRQ